MEASTDDCDDDMDDRTDETEAETEEASVVTGTGTAVVPAEPDDVLNESSDANDEAALDNTLENWDASELDTPESVAVAATLDSSELSEDARLESALDAAAVTVDWTLVLLPA
ncbi:hypothetical protein B0A55_02468 [Friedmanniomyces simplex]|uniref:Uncharacterized protein n=1 Tax=Friedmanniomyces simplex TaxID=329884 RepID=A0A4U0XUA8_9PEZI|nr:hypothetical protein B0A55_02468 [Friedmanniomyces simplex]